MAARIQFEHWVPMELDRVFRFFANPQNLPRIMPPAIGTKLIRLELQAPAGAPAGISPAQIAGLAGVGSEITTSFRMIPRLPFRLRWIARIVEFEWNHHFADVQAKGPLSQFHHRHEFSSEIREGKDGTLVRDVIDYDLGFGLLGRIADAAIFRAQLRRTFQHRQRVLESLLTG